MTPSSCRLTTRRRQKLAESRRRRGNVLWCRGFKSTDFGVRSPNCHQERCMNKLGIRLLTLAMLSLTLAAAPVVSVVYAAPDNDPPPPDKKKKKSSEARPGIEQTAFAQNAFASGYRAAYAAIYDRHDYTSAIT